MAGCAALSRWLQLSKQKIRGVNWHRAAVSTWSCLTFVGLGTALNIFGPTLLDLAVHLKVEVSALAIMFTVRGLGSILGTVSSGWAFDRFEKLAYLMLSLIILMGVITMSVMPFSVHIVMFGVFIFSNGFFTAAIDTGSHGVLMKMWRHEVGPLMQFIHFSFAFGAFIAPLVAKPFLQEETELDPLLLNSTNQTSNVTCSFLNQSSLPQECHDLYLTECSNSSDMNTETFISTDLLAEVNCTIGNQLVDTLYFAWAYCICALPLAVACFPFLYFALRYELAHLGCCCCSCFRNKKQAVYVSLAETSDSSPAGQENPATASNEEEKEEEEEEGEEEKGSVTTAENVAQTTNNNNNNSSSNKKQPFWHKIVIYILLFCFMFCYVGLETAFGSLVLTFAVRGLDFSKQRAAYLTSVFWGTFAFARFFAVVLALLKVRPAFMMVANVTGSLVASAVLVAFSHSSSNSVVVWLGTAGLGASMASIFPTAMSWMGQHLHMSARAAAVLNAGSTAGDMTLPAIAGALIDKVTPLSLLYFTFADVVLCGVLVSVMFTVTYISEKRTRSATHNTSAASTAGGSSVAYNRLLETEEDMEGLDGDRATNLSSAAANGSQEKLFQEDQERGERATDNNTIDAGKTCSNDRLEMDELDADRAVKLNANDSQQQLLQNQGEHTSTSKVVV